MTEDRRSCIRKPPAAPSAVIGESISARRAFSDSGNCAEKAARSPLPSDRPRSSTAGPASQHARSRTRPCRKCFHPPFEIMRALDNPVDAARSENPGRSARRLISADGPPVEPFGSLNRGESPAGDKTPVQHPSGPTTSCPNAAASSTMTEDRPRPPRARCGRPSTRAHPAGKNGRDDATSPIRDIR